MPLINGKVKPMKKFNSTTLITIHRLNDDAFKSVKGLTVSDEQVGFVEPIEQILKNLSNQVHGHVINDTRGAVGFFLIDTQYANDYEFCSQDSIGLRSFFIDKRYQGCGYGKETVRLLQNYLSDIYDSYDDVYLTVNCENPAAKHCYEQGGFIDTGELYFGGDYGPQHIMKLSLKAELV